MHLVMHRRQCRYEAGQVHSDSERAHPGAVVIAKGMMCELMLSWKNSHMELSQSWNCEWLTLISLKRVEGAADAAVTTASRVTRRTSMVIQ
jgi:hypothetical protein